MEARLTDPWLVAVWPGMGAVAHLAGSFLAKSLGAQPVAELDTSSFFELRSVHVHDGILQRPQPPRAVLLGWKNPDPEGRDLLVFIGDQQPQARIQEYAEDILAVVRNEFGVSRVFTFAALGTPTHPSEAARVFAVVTDEQMKAALASADVQFLPEGDIGGLNGVFLAAAAMKGLSGACLMGEFPFFAGGIPNPKAASAVLRAFSQIAGIEIDRSELDQQAAIVERNLSAQLERLQGMAREMQAGAEQGEGEEEFQVSADEEDEVPPHILARIETLFSQAKHDRKKALELKAELDRWNLFKRYEDRFLDLFKSAE